MKPSALVLVLFGACAAGASAQDGGAAAPRADGTTPRYAQYAADAIMPVGNNNNNNSNAGDAGQVGVLFGRQAVGATAGKGGLHFYSGDAHPVAPLSAYAAGDVAGAPSGNRAWGISLGFEQGPLTIRAAHQNRDLTPVAPATPMGNSTEAKNSLLSANLRVGIATAYAAYSVNRGWGSSPLFNPDNPYGASMASTPSTDSRDVLVGLAVPSGATTWLASYVHKNDRDLANRDARQLALGASYALSRRTDFYAAWSLTSGRAGAAMAGTDHGGARSGADAALNLGMRHAF